ncbi:hypothetical protein SH139x_002875 [Planctomycetaceae bacterium SH139]
MESQKLDRDLRNEKAARAQQMSLDERLTAGPRLYDEQMRLTRSLIAGLHPEWADVQVDMEISRREELIRQRNTKKYYRPLLAAETRAVEPS